MPSVLIRADASPHIGGGHVVRTLALGLALQESGFEVFYATRPETHLTIPFLRQCGFRLITLDCQVEEEAFCLRQHSPEGLEVLLVDHYQRGLSFEAQCREFARAIMVLEDSPGRPHDCDFLLDQTLGRRVEEYRGWVPTGCRVLAGIDFALLRPQFSLARSSSDLKPRTVLNRILLMAGASDPLNLHGWVLTALNEFPESLTLDVIGVSHGGLPHRHRCTFHQNVADPVPLMTSADLAIGAAGSASWERCCLGLPSFLFVTADNQRKICSELEKAGVARNLGEVGLLDPLEFCHRIWEVRSHPDWLAQASSKAFALCDGQGAGRAARVLRETLVLREELS